METIRRPAHHARQIVDLDERRAPGGPGPRGHDRRRRAGPKGGVDVAHAVGPPPGPGEEHEPGLDETAVHGEPADAGIPGRARRHPDRVGKQGANVHGAGA